MGFQAFSARSLRDYGHHEEPRGTSCLPRRRLGHDLLDIVAKYVEKPEVEKGAELSLAGISQKFTKYTIVINAEKTPDMLKGILTYIP